MLLIKTSVAAAICTTPPRRSSRAYVIKLRGLRRIKGAVILIENDKMNIKQYKDVVHPFHLPGAMDLFKWSVPFLMEKIGDMMEHLLSKSRAAEISSMDAEEVKVILEKQQTE